LEDLSRLKYGNCAETNVDSVQLINGDVYFEMGSLPKDIEKIEELTRERDDFEAKLIQLKTDYGREEFLDELRKELNDRADNIERAANQKVKKWEEFARQCYNSLTPKWKEKMWYKAAEMNEFIAQSNGEINKFE